MAKYNIIRDSIQHKFNLARKKIQIMGGGFGNGKTAAVCVKVFDIAMNYPGSNGLMARESYVKLNDTLRKEFYKWIPHESVARWPTTNDNTLIFKNRSVVNFRYIAQRGKKTTDGHTTSNLLSATYDYVVVDQIEDPQIMYKDFLDLLGRLRGSTAYKGNDPTMPISGPRFLMLTSNPTSNWVYKKLIKPLHQYMATGVVTDDLIYDVEFDEVLIELHEGSTYGNKHNLDADFIRGLESTYKGQMKKRFLLGEWAAFEGLVYPEFSRNMHVLKHEDMEAMLNDRLQDRNRYENIEGFDFGIVVPSCYLFGYVDDLGRIFIIDGFYKPNMSLKQMASDILDIKRKYAYGIDYLNPMWSDPSIFKRTQVHGKTVTTIAKLLKEEGIRLKAGQNDVTNGIMKVSGYLNIIPTFHYLDPTKHGPGIYFSDRLDFVADEFMSYFWKTNDLGVRIDQPNGRDDHAMDTIKYMLSRVPDATEIRFKQETLRPEYFKWQEAI